EDDANNRVGNASASENGQSLCESIISDSKLLTTTTSAHDDSIEEEHSLVVTPPLATDNTLIANVSGDGKDSVKLKQSDTESEWFISIDQEDLPFPCQNPEQLNQQYDFTEEASIREGYSKNQRYHSVQPHKLNSSSTHPLRPPAKVEVQPISELSGSKSLYNNHSFAHSTKAPKNWYQAAVNPSRRRRSSQIVYIDSDEDTEDVVKSVKQKLGSVQKQVPQHTTSSVTFSDGHRKSGSSFLVSKSSKVFGPDEEHSLPNNLASHRRRSCVNEQICTKSNPNMKLIPILKKDPLSPRLKQQGRSLDTFPVKSKSCDNMGQHADNSVFYEEVSEDKKSSFSIIRNHHESIVFSNSSILEAHQDASFAERSKGTINKEAQSVVQTYILANTQTSYPVSLPNVFDSRSKSGTSQSTPVIINVAKQNAPVQLNKRIHRLSLLANRKENLGPANFEK
ncbi:unnamed protein product, partial [Protopolystoma xenopodis]